MVYNLRSRRLHARGIEEIHRRIADYQTRHPGRPVFVMGHSGGGGLTMLALASLPDHCQITGAVLLGPAISPGYDPTEALKHVERGIWNVRSIGDLIFLGVLTTIAGTIDGKHVPAAGAVGFVNSTTEKSESGPPRLIDVPYRFEMARQWNFGGHFGCVNRRFIQHWVAPILMESAVS
jgi:pimeloyl-ACP methyl ester carboxylesterase